MNTGLFYFMILSRTFFMRGTNVNYIIYILEWGKLWVSILHGAISLGY